MAEAAPRPNLDHLPVALLTVGLDGFISHANLAAAELVGVAATALAGSHVDQLLSAGGRILYHTYLLPLLRLHGRVQEFALPLAAASGAANEALVYASLAPESDPPRIEIALVPMRERRRVEAELLRVQRAADSAPGMLFECVIGADGRSRLPYASVGLRALFGLGPESVREDDSAMLERVHPQDRAALHQSREEAAAAEQLWVARYRARARDDAPWSWHSVRAVPRRVDADTLVLHGIVTDITRQVEMEQAEGERDAAARANLAKSEFLARMSHELRTPLNGVIGFARLLATDRHAALSPEQRRRVGVIESSGQHLLRLINEVLDISRIEAGHLEVALATVALQPVLARAVQMTEPMAEAAGVTLALAVDAGACVSADPARLEQVMANLMSNAVKYNRPHGRVDVAVRSAGGMTAIEVEDTGAGLTRAQREQLFQPFNRLGAEQSRTEGTGLGLVITRNLVELMQGRIEVASEPGIGSRFTVWLPSAAPLDNLAPQAAAAAPRPAPVLAGRRVLYVEDNPVNAMLMECVVEACPELELRVAADGRAAICSAKAARPHLLLIDMHLPDIDGRRLLEQLRALPGLERVPAVAVSASAMAEDLSSARQAGFADYWTKPLDVGSLIERIHGLLAAPD